jgi:hypothetical protein
MTIQIVDITHLGIVMAADGAVSFINTRLAGQRNPENWRRIKLFRIPNLRAGIGYFGLAQVSGQLMETWLEKFIHKNASMATLHEFAHSLASALPAETNVNEGQQKSGFHLAGYGTIGDGNLPEMHFIRNYEGKSILPNRKFRATEELSRNNFQGFRTNDLQEGIFIQNGYHEVYNIFSQPIVHAFRDHIWPDPEFVGEPKTASEWAKMTEFRMQVVRMVFEKFHGNLGNQPVGGRLSFLTIPANQSEPIEDWSIG